MFINVILWIALQSYLNLESLPDAVSQADAENDVFETIVDDEAERSLMLGGMPHGHGSDSQYVSLTSSEAPSSPEHSIKSFIQDTVVWLNDCIERCISGVVLLFSLGQHLLFLPLPSP